MKAMNYISERIVNLSNYEKKISDAILHSEHLMTMFKNNEFKESIIVAQFINKNLKELRNFEFIIEHRKVSNKNREGEIAISPEERIEILEKKVAELEGQVQEQPSVENLTKEISIKINQKLKELLRSL